jgi:hypothetical protein
VFRYILDTLYGSVSTEFPSEFSVEESIARLRACTKRTVFSALTQESAVGKVSEDRVSLQRVIPFFGNSFKPFFIGAFRRTAAGVVLSGRFTMIWPVKIFMSFWLGFCFLWTLGASFAVIRDRPANWFFPVFGVGMFAVGVGFVRLCQRFSRRDVEWLSEIIRSALSNRAA